MAPRRRSPRADFSKTANEAGADAAQFEPPDVVGAERDASAAMPPRMSNEERHRLAMLFADLIMADLARRRFTASEE
jgi:hypothetical protein